jgi:hypothetical protein
MEKRKYDYASHVDNNPDFTLSHRIIASSNSTLRQQVLHFISGHIPHIM